MLSSPPELRQSMTGQPPPAGLQRYSVMPAPGQSRDRQILQKMKQSRDIHAGVFQVAAPDQAIQEPYGEDVLNYPVSIYNIVHSTSTINNDNKCILVHTVEQKLSK